MKYLYLLAGVAALTAAAPSPAANPIFGWFENRQEQQQQQQSASAALDPATSAEVSFVSKDYPDGQNFNLTLPGFYGLPTVKNPSRAQMVRGPAGSDAVCYILDQFNMIDEQRSFREGPGNAYEVSGSPLPVNYIFCAIEEQSERETVLKFTSPGDNGPTETDVRIGVPGSVHITRADLQGATQVAMESHPVPNTVCFLMGEQGGKAFVIGTIQIESRQPYRAESSDPDIVYVSCLPPVEALTAS